MLTCPQQSAAHIHMYVCIELCAFTVAISSDVVLTVCWDYCVHSTVCGLQTSMLSHTVRLCRHTLYMSSHTVYAVTHCIFRHKHVRGGTVMEISGSLKDVYTVATYVLLVVLL